MREKQYLLDFVRAFKRRLPVHRAAEYTDDQQIAALKTLGAQVQQKEDDTDVAINAVRPYGETVQSISNYSAEAEAGLEEIGGHKRGQRHFWLIASV